LRMGIPQRAVHPGGHEVGRLHADRGVEREPSRVHLVEHGHADRGLVHALHGEMTVRVPGHRLAGLDDAHGGAEGARRFLLDPRQLGPEPGQIAPRHQRQHDRRVSEHAYDPTPPRSSNVRARTRVD
jgi:hypothetical protein